MRESEMLKYYNISNVFNLKCAYYPIKRFDDWNNYEIELTGRSKMNMVYGNVEDVTRMFINICCTYKKEIIYSDYHYFPILPETENSEPVTVSAEKQFSVMILGYNSANISTSFKYKKTINSILRKYDGLELFGYNKIASTTYSNLFPILSALNLKEFGDLFLTDFISTSYNDGYFIWDYFKYYDYKTAFGENAAEFSLFQYDNVGFDKEPCDYYARPMFLNLEFDMLNKHLCLNENQKIKYLTDFIFKTMEAIGSDPSFSFYWFSNVTPTTVDNFATFLNKLMARKEMANTFLFLIDDSGPRFDDFLTSDSIDILLQPHNYLIPPKSFQNHFPYALKNLKENQAKLSANYDLFETMWDLLNLTSLTENSINERTTDLLSNEIYKRGISLFLPHPKNRTCEQAGILKEWCVQDGNV